MSGQTQGGATFFVHPRGLATLFFTEMWERFSHYGMRALVILFMTAAAAEGGLEYSIPKAGAIYALYTSMIYLMSLPGGWIADRYLGQRRSVFWGGVLIALGQFTLVIHDERTFFAGLVLIVVGTGLLKPNVTTMVGQLYDPTDYRRDAAYSIFYMGTNVGAFSAPLICGLVGEQIDWHLGFAVAGIGMILGLVQYRLGGRHLGDAGLHPVRPDDPARAAAQNRMLILGLGLVALVVVVAVLLQVTGTVRITAGGLADSFGIFLLALTVVFFGWLFLQRGWTEVERKRLVAILVLFLAFCFFSGACTQAGSPLNFFAGAQSEYPALGFLSLAALFGLIQAPIFAWVWIRLGRRQPSSPAKFALGLLFAGLGFVVMAGGSLLTAGGAKVGAQWLLVTFFLHVMADICLIPVGWSAVNKLAPARVASLMMGVWFLATAIGNYLGGRALGLYGAWPLSQLLGIVAVTTIVGGLILACLVGPIRRLMGGLN